MSNFACKKTKDVMFMKQFVTFLLLIVSTTAFGQKVTLRALQCMNDKYQTEKCKIDVTFELEDSTICIKEGKNVKELRIIDYTSWRAFEDYELPWELNDPMLFYLGRNKYFMAKQNGRRDPYDIYLYITADGRLCMVIDDCEKWDLYMPVTIINNEKVKPQKNKAL